MGVNEGYHWPPRRWQPTPAQVRVLDRLVQGDSNAVIAGQLGLSAETVKAHVSVLLAETGCANRQELARWWQRQQHRPTRVLAPFRHSRWAAIAVGMLASILLVLAAVRATAPGRPAARSLSSSLSPVTARPSPAPALAGPQDVGLFVVHTTGPLLVNNRAAASAVTLAVGDLIQFPGAMRWDPPPGVSVNPKTFLMPSAVVSGTKLYLTVYTSTGGVRFAPVDDHSFRAISAGIVLITAQERRSDSAMVDHPLIVTAAGRLLLDPRPVPGTIVADYSSGQRLDVERMTQIGRLPLTHAGYPSEWFFTTCGDGRCSVSYRIRQLVAPVAGTLLCQDGPNFDLDTGTFRLQFRDTGTLRNNPTWPGAPGNCGPSRTVQAGDVLLEAFTHVLVSAISETGEPLSVAVAYDGTLYVGPLVVPDSGTVGRGT
jgi:DNA-binding CsgD family transcriptional regulator